MKVSRSCDSGGLGVDAEQVAAFDCDQFLDLVAARPALELAAERAVGAVGARATAAGGGPYVLFANRVAATNDHGCIDSANATYSQ